MNIKVQITYNVHNINNKTYKTIKHRNNIK